MSQRILIIGAASMNVTVQLSQMPKPEQTTLSQGGFSFSPGGEGGMNAVAFAQYGAAAYLCTRVGGDSHGARLTDFYAKSHVHTDLITVNPDVPTCTACHVIETEPYSRRTALFNGAGTTLLPSHINRAFEIHPQAVFMTMEADPRILAMAASMAEERAIPTFLEASPVLDNISFADIPHVNVLTLNEEEALALTGIRPAGSDSCLLTGIRLQNLIDADFYVIKLGKRGAFVYDGIYCHSIAAFVVPVNDASGAGAAFNAALCSAYLSSGGNIREAARYANAAGALTVQRNGLYKSFPTSEETEAFLRHHTRS